MELKNIEKINKIGVLLNILGPLIFIGTIIYMVMTSSNGVSNGSDAFISIIGMLVGVVLFIVGYIFSNFKGLESDAEKILNKSVDEIERLYQNNPQGFVIHSPESQHLRDIGQKLYDAGGMDLMLQAHRIATVRGVNGKNLEACWDGIGEWVG